MKRIREYINEKFEEESDPVKDLRIGGIDLEKAYTETVINGLNKWYKYLKDLDLIGKKITFEDLWTHKENTIIVSEITRGQLPNEIYFYSDTGLKCSLNIRKKIYIHE